MNAFDKDQMHRMRNLLLGEKNNNKSGTTFLRLFTGKKKYDTIKKVRTINFLRKLTNLEGIKLPKEILNNWENDKNPDIRSNCRKMWDKYRDIAINKKDLETKKIFFKNEFQHHFC